MYDFEDNQAELEAKIKELESKLDDALLAKFDLELKQKSDGMMRYELEEMIRNIFHACKNVSESEENRHEEKPDLDTVLKNLSENIRIFAKDYNIDL